MFLNGPQFMENDFSSFKPKVSVLVGMLSLSTLNLVNTSRCFSMVLLALYESAHIVVSQNFQNNQAYYQSKILQRFISKTDKSKRKYWVENLTKVRQIY